MKIHQKEKELIPASGINIGDMEMLYTNTNPSLYMKDDDNNLIRFITEIDFEGYEEELSQKVSSGDLATKQDILTPGSGISIVKKDDETIISTTIDMGLYKVVSTLPTEDIDTNKVYLVVDASGAESNVYKEYVYIEGKGWELLGEYRAEINLSEYLKIKDAEKTYIKTPTSAQISFSNNGSMNSFGNNGQAFNAVRNCSAQTITKSDLNAAAFGVKMDGTAAFTHKTYVSFNPTTGVYGGAKNTAVLTFSGPTGLRYAKNTGSSSDVTEEMFKYVGVIDSLDENQRVYSAKQVDALIKDLQDQINELKNK